MIKLRIIRKSIPLLTHRETVELVFLGDIHIGHVNVDYEYLESVIDYIKRTDRCWFIGMGDYMDSITVNDRRFNWDSIDLSCKTPNEQYEKIVELFKPIRRKCIGLLTGNHEYSLWNNQKSGDYVSALCIRLSDDNYVIPYGTYDAVFLLDFQREQTGSRVVKIYAHHGWTSARTEGGIAVRLRDMQETFPNMDIYAMGHIHRLGMMPLIQQLEVARIKGEDVIVSRNLNRVLTGGFLKGYEDKKMSYIEQKTYPPTGLGAPLLKIQPFRCGRGGGYDYLKISYEQLPNDLP